MRFSFPKTAHSRQRMGRRRIGLEQLEDRRVLATFMVTNTLDAGAGSLRQAVTDANNAAGLDDIVFDAAVAGMTISLTSGELLITDSVDIVGTGETVDGGGLSRVLNVDAGGAGINVSVSDMTLSNGAIAGGSGGVVRNIENLTLTNANVTGGQADFGGGIFNDGGTLSLNDSTLVNSTAAYQGGGLYNRNAGTVMIDGSTVDGNLVINAADYDALGGGISNEGTGSEITIVDSYLTNNVADHDDTTYVQQGLGAAIANDYYATLTITDTMITGNTADFGGGLWTDDGVVNTLTNVTVQDNYVYIDGAGLYFRDYSQTTIDQSLITNNYAVDDAGGISNSTGATVTLTNSMVTMNSAGDRAAGIRNTSFGNVDRTTYLNLVDSFVTGNSAGGIGGGVYFGTKFVGDIRNSYIDNNSAVDGGGIFASGFNNPYALYTSQITVVDSSISGNSASDDGGGAAIDSVVSIYFDGVTVANNYAYDRAGGLRMAFGDPGYNRTAVIENSTITGNTSIDVGGGLYFGNQTTTARVVDSTVSDNYSQSGGGGIFMGFGSDIDITGSTLSGNRAFNNGGGFTAENVTLDLTLSTLSGNSATNNGGGGYFYGTYAEYYSLTVDQSTITENTADLGGGGLGSPYGYSPITVRSSILANNTALLYGPDWYSTGSASSAYYSLIGNNSDTLLAEANPDANGNIVGGPVGGLINPMLGALADNGGPTFTHALDPASPAVDQSDPAIVGGNDQRGFDRVVNGRADMGSYEYGATTGVDGDFNDDGNWDCADIDALTAETAAGTNNLAFDLTGDGFVNGADIAAWLVEGGAMNPAQTGGNPFLPGDADLSGAVDGADFIAWNGNKFTASTAWCGGNFDGNGATDGSDFIIWNANKFTSSDAVGRRVGNGPGAGDSAAVADNGGGDERRRIFRESVATQPEANLLRVPQAAAQQDLAVSGESRSDVGVRANAVPQLAAWNAEAMSSQADHQRETATELVFADAADWL